MNVVRTGLRDKADRSCGLAATRGSRGAGFDFEFLESIGEGRGHVPVALGVHVKCSIQRVIQSSVQTASDRKGRAGLIERISRARVRSWCRRCCSRKRNQFGSLTAVQRQFQNSRVLDDLADARAARFDQRGVGLNLDGLCDLADLQRDVDYRIAVDLQDKSRLGVCAEARQGRFQFVRTQGQVL